MHDLKMEIYWRLPVPIQEFILSRYGKHLDKVYYGEEYEKTKQWLIEHKHSEIPDWQIDRLKYIIKIAAGKTRYYKQAWKDVDWLKVETPKDLKLLPVLNKYSIQQNEESFLVNGLDAKSLWMEKTSGTTGTSLKIYWPYKMAQQWYAINEVMSRYVAGVSREMPRAMVGGRPIIPGKTNKPPYWRFNKTWQQIYFSSYHISRNTVPDYVKALRKYQPVWMTGYGSTIAALADYAIESGIEPFLLKSVIVSGDTLTKSMRKSIEKYFQCKCYDHYGQSEGVAVFMECEHGRMHVVPQVGITEILDEDGNECKPGQVGELVVTSLLNDAMPLIRYKIGDYAAWSEEQKCACGNRNKIIQNLEGRVDDYLITADGRKIGRLSTAIKRSPSIHSAQIVQDKPGHAFLLVRKGNGYNKTDAFAVRDDILERIGEFYIDIEEVPEIPKTPQGKTKLVIRIADQKWATEIYKKYISIP